jgi:hypothetical protein
VVSLTTPVRRLRSLLTLLVTALVIMLVITLVATSGGRTTRGETNEQVCEKNSQARQATHHVTRY